MRISRVKIRKCTRRTLLMRKKIVTVPEKTTRDLHSSARSPTMLSDNEVDRIRSYVQSMEDPAQVPGEMNKTRIIDNQNHKEVVDSISK